MASAKKSFKGPKGTRDVYPEEMLRRRYILQSWRETSIRHGFEEIGRRKGYYRREGEDAILMELRL